MSLSTITLPTNKSISVVDDDRRRIRQSEKGLSLPVILLNADGSAYDLTDKKLVFSEEKVGDKIVVDDGVGRDSGTITITDAKAGKFTYTLQEQVYVESGTCWFEILTGDTVVDTTKNFYFDVDKDATIHPINDSYISRLVALEDHLQGSIQKAEESIGQVSTNLTNTANKAKQDAINAINDAKANAENTLQQLQNQYNDYQNRYNDLQNQWNQQKQKIQSDADNQRNQIKAESDRVRQDAINQINSARDNAIAQANRDFTDRINSLQNDYIAWKNRTVADFNSTAKTIMDKINQQNANVDGVKKQMADIQAQINNVLNKFSSVDFTKFIKQEDLARSGTNLLRNTENLSGFFEFGSANNLSNNYAIEYVTGHNGDQHSNEEGIDLVQTAIFHAYGPTYHNVGLAFGQNVFLAKGTYTLSFVARCNGTPTGEHIEFWATNLDNNSQLNKLAVSDPLTDRWKEYSLTFTIIEAGNYTDLRLHTDTNSPVPGGSVYYANLKLESGNIATGWTWNYDDILNAKDWPISITDIHDIIMPGIYRFTNLSDQQWNALKNTPPGDKYTVIEVLSRESLFGGDKSIKAYPTTETGQIYYSSKNASGWSAWNPLFIDTYNKGEIDDKIRNAGQVKKVNGINPDPSGNINVGSQIVRAYDAFAKTSSQRAWENIGGSWLIDQAALGSIVDRIDELGIRPLPENTDINNFKFSGNWKVTDQKGIKGSPTEPNWFNLINIVISEWNGIQIVSSTNQDGIWFRTWASSAWKAWHRISTEEKVNIDGALFHNVNVGNNWNDILGFDNGTTSALVGFRADSSNSLNNLLGNYSAGVAFGGGDTKGFLEVSYGERRARIGGGNGNAPVWHEDIAWKSDINALWGQLNQLKSQVLTSYTTNNLQDGINHSNQNLNQIVFVTN